MTDSFDCPIPWCTGNRAEHGDEGDSPETWLHTSGIDNHGIGVGAFYQEGSGAISYHLTLQGELGGSGADLTLAAEQLRTLASMIESRAAQLADPGQQPAPRAPRLRHRARARACRIRRGT